MAGDQIVPSDPSLPTKQGAPSPIEMSPAPGPLMPTAPIIDKKTYASTMSYVGITRRTTAWVRKVGQNSAAAAYFAWCAAAFFLLFMYVFLVAWYLVVFVIFGFFTLPFRLIRRGQRKQTHLQQTQLATMQAMLIQQQRAMAPGEQPTIGDHAPTAPE